MRITLLFLFMLSFGSTLFAQNTGTVILYRDGGRRGSWSNARIYANDKQIATVKNNEAVAVILPADDYMFTEDKDKRSRKAISVPKNDTVYVRGDVQRYATYNRFEFVIMDKKQGKLEVKTLNK